MTYMLIMRTEAEAAEQGSAAGDPRPGV